LKDQLILLEELQRHDAQLQEMEAALGAMPARLKQMSADLQRVEQMLAQERTQLAETEGYRGEQEQSLRNEEQLAQKAKVKLQGVKNTKEYMATQRELETTRKMSQEREEEVLKLMTAIEEFKKKIAAHEADLNVIRETVAKEELDAQGRMAELGAQLAEAKRTRDEVAHRVRPDVMRRYSGIRMRRGLAVVAVKNGTCQGCNMRIPPQLFNILQRGETIETCPTCARIVYWDKLMEERELDQKEQEQQQTDQQGT
jgi:predicted  nucleic acid-binding Zn-ribbon protein